MPTLDDQNEDYKKALASATHMLGIGQSKAGKTDFAVQAAVDGFELLYVDKDNGMATIKDEVAKLPAAIRQSVLKRIHYFSPKNMPEFIEGVLTNAVVRYNISLQEIYDRARAKPGHRISEFYPSRIPANTILCIDSWTTLTFSIVQAKAEANGIDLLDVDKYSREIYGGTGFKATQIAQLLQFAPFHVYVQAHPGNYERKEKPPGVVKEVKENDMIIKETVAVPLSTSLPHGYTIGKYFNQIGWFEINRFDKFVLDFTQRSGRISGGTVAKKLGDPRTELRFSQVFGKPTPPEEIKEWEKEYEFEEFVKLQAERQAARPTLATKPTPTLATKPVAAAAKT